MSHSQALPDKASCIEDLINVCPSHAVVCSICKEEWGADHVPVLLRTCGHIFGKSCLLEWFDLSNTCPLDRQQVFDTSNIELFTDDESELSELDDETDIFPPDYFGQRQDVLFSEDFRAHPVRTIFLVSSSQNMRQVSHECAMFEHSLFKRLTGIEGFVNACGDSAVPFSLADIEPEVLRIVGPLLQYQSLFPTTAIKHRARSTLKDLIKVVFQRLQLARETGRRDNLSWEDIEAAAQDMYRAIGLSVVNDPQI